MCSGRDPAVLVTKKLLEDLKEEIGEKRTFSEIRTILNQLQLTDKALDLIGYKIVWNGLISVKIVEITQIENNKK